MTAKETEADDEKGTGSCGASEASGPAPAEPAKRSSGHQRARTEGHDLRTYFGHYIYLRCYQMAKMDKAKHRGLAAECAPAKLPSAQAERKRKAEKFMRGIDRSSNTLRRAYAGA